MRTEIELRINTIHILIHLLKKKNVSDPYLEFNSKTLIDDYFFLSDSYSFNSDEQRLFPSKIYTE